MERHRVTHPHLIDHFHWCTQVGKICCPAPSAGVLVTAPEKIPALPAVEYQTVYAGWR